MNLLNGMGGMGRSAPAPELLKFKAGQCDMVPLGGGRFKVTPNKAAGVIKLEKSFDGSIVFSWTNTMTNRVENKKNVFPGAASFKKVKTGRPDDRVYMLHFLGDSPDSPKLMFWLQDKDASTDAENVSNFNKHIQAYALVDFGSILSQFSGADAAPATPMATGAAPAPPAAPAPTTTTTASASASAASASAAAPQTPSASSGLTASDLQRAVRSHQSRAGSRPLALEDLLTAEAIIASGLLNDPAGKRLSNVIVVVMRNL